MNFTLKKILSNRKYFKLSQQRILTPFSNLNVSTADQYKKQLTDTNQNEFIV